HTSSDRDWSSDVCSSDLCFAGCPGEHPLTKPIYRCPTCDGLLVVEHDLDALRDRSAAAWMKLFDERYMRTAWPYGSGVWGKRERSEERRVGNESGWGWWR